MRRIFTAISIGVMGFMLGLAAVLPASAHSELIASSPAEGSQTSEVSSVSLTLSEEIVPEYTKITLTSSDGAEVALDAPTMDATNTIVSANVIDGVLSDGAYVLGFYIVSIDGHPIEGIVNFEVVGAPAPEQSATPSPDPSVMPTDEATAVPLSIDPRIAQSGVSTGVDWVWIGTGVAAVVVLGAVSAVLLVALRRRRDATK